MKVHCAHGGGLGCLAVLEPEEGGELLSENEMETISWLQTCL